MIDFTFENYEGSYSKTIEARSYEEALTHPSLDDKIIINGVCNYECKRINNPQVEWDFELAFYGGVNPCSAEYRFDEAAHNREVYRRRWDAADRDILFAGLDLELYHVWDNAVDVMADYLEALLHAHEH